MAILVGARYGKLTTLRETNERLWGAIAWECLCDCGTITQVASRALNSGNTKSCGCQRHISRIRHGATRRRLDGTKATTTEYKAWQHAKERVLNPNTKQWKDYGGRGITMYKEWISNFESFLAYLGPKPSPFHSLDRIDNNGNYEPGNVRWATRSQQAANKRSLAALQEKVDTLTYFLLLGVS